MLGLDRAGGDGQLDDEFVGRVMAAMPPGPPGPSRRVVGDARGRASRRDRGVGEGG